MIFTRKCIFPFRSASRFLTSEDEKTKGKSRLQIYKKNLTSYKKNARTSLPVHFHFLWISFQKKLRISQKKKSKSPVSFHITPFPDTRIFFPYKHLYTPASEKRADIKDIRGHLSCKTGEEKYEAKKTVFSLLMTPFSTFYIIYARAHYINKRLAVG